jgi:hypothetical protein
VRGFWFSFFVDHLFGIPGRTRQSFPDV